MKKTMLLCWFMQSIIKYIAIICFIFITLSCFGQGLSNVEYKALAALFSADVANSNITDTYASYSSLRSTTAYTHTPILRLSSNSSIATTNLDKILIIVNSSIYNQLQSKIIRYACDINFAYGCEVIMETVINDNHIDIKSLILSHQTNLDGVVLIGDISVAWYEIADDHDQYGYASWPCDLFYMDLNGSWADSNNNGIYDSHTGNVQPEIFVGRISTANMGTLLSEVTSLSQYLDKNHLFWAGQISVNRQFGLSYTDKDWTSFGYFKTDIQYLYGNTKYDAIWYGNSQFGKSDFLNRIKNDRYEFIQLSCHASYYYLAMSGGNIYSNEIFNNGTKAKGYNLFSCSAARWTSVSSNSTQGFLAGSFVYNSNTLNLVVVGSTKTGSMLQFDKFYTPLGQGKTMGEALKQWWVNACGAYHSNYIVSWHYGMSIIGDPMVNFYQCTNGTQCLNQVTLNSFDSSNTASYRYIVAKDLTVNNYVIPSGKYVIFNAKEVQLNAGFECQIGDSFEIINEGCIFNCP